MELRKRGRRSSTRNARRIPRQRNEGQCVGEAESQREDQDGIISRSVSLSVVSPIAG